ncbi:phage/plasmid replication protein [uncultured Caballeronia sp.]|uniref:phage/plasmid replication domain-containing protein n=1 Tax=uncultured Caballeronia sp. TaxID=1827198 RepID=UPI0035CADD54
MFYDWIKAAQDYPHDLRKVTDVLIRRVDPDTEETLSESTSAFHAEGSYCTTFRIHVHGRRITVDGNASRINRLDNVFGIQRLDDNMRVINSVLAEWDLPPLTKCTKVEHLQNGGTLTDGAVFQRLDLTENFSVGQGNERAFLRGISSQRFRHSIGYLYPDGNTTVWTPKGGEKAGRLVYPGNYNKAAEMDAHLLPKVKRTYGADSAEFAYVEQLRDWCVSRGVVRSEIKLRSEFLRRERLCHWGLFDEERLREIHREFLTVGDRMKVSAMDIFSISEQLLAEGLCNSLQAASRTATYAMEWMNGKQFDISKSAVKTHRARLRQIGIDIKSPFDSSRHGVVFVRNVREVERSFNLAPPSFYRPAVIPSHLRLVAA